ncbi:hypothetical protein TNIN_41241 [Trichonephila inaurata madagascariensis]|uniref:Uncharacterized protein n=1 Tax=Trichonephila inaurata madagascariensis TaxID=2747483 RepID=A0A8X6YJU7_9ARAC|nr:hypothetical protein TNIN_41241 [Trichonephila inaurata madagascariensis]
MHKSNIIQSDCDLGSISDSLTLSIKWEATNDCNCRNRSTPKSITTIQFPWIPAQRVRSATAFTVWVFERRKRGRGKEETVFERHRILGTREPLEHGSASKVGARLDKIQIRVGSGNGIRILSPSPPLL